MRFACNSTIIVMVVPMWNCACLVDTDLVFERMGAKQVSLKSREGRGLSTNQIAASSLVPSFAASSASCFMESMVK